MRRPILFVVLALQVAGGFSKVYASDSEKPVDAPKSENAAKQVPDTQAGPRPASVLFVGGMKIEKCWAEEKPKGAWIIYEGRRYWYLRENIEKIAYLEGEPDGDLKDWLKKADEARKKEDERTHQADEEREKKAQAEASVTPPASGGGSGSSTSTSSGSDAFKPGAAQAAETRTGGKTTGGGNDGGTRRTGGGVVAGSGGNPNGTGIVGGNGVIGGNGVVGGGNLLGSQLGYQWRVKDVNRKLNTIRIKNRLFNEAITLKVKEPDDLKHVKEGQILTGMLSAQQPLLNAPDGTVIEFDLTQAGLNPQP